MPFQERYRAIRPAFIRDAKQLTALLDAMNDTRPGDATVRNIQELFSNLENELSSLQASVSMVLHPEGPTAPLERFFNELDDSTGFQRPGR